MKARLFGVLAVGLLYGLACNGITYPTSPAPAPSSSAPVATNILLTAAPERLPSNGGTSIVTLRVIASGGAGVPGAAVKLSSTEGELDITDVTTNDVGDASVRWTTTKTGTVIARMGAIDASVTIPVQTDAPPPPPSPGPPAPGPPGPPAPPSEPTLIVDIFATGDMDVLSEIHFAAAVKLSTTGAGAPIGGFAWDFNSDGVVDSRAAAPAHTFPAGHHTVTLDVTATDGRTGRGTRALAIGAAPPPGVTASLSATSSPAIVGDTITFSATAVPSKTGGAVTRFDWEFGDGATDTTAVGSTTHVYNAVGTHSARVTARTSTGHMGTASRAVTVNAPAPPPLAVTLTADATTVVVGTTVTFTTSITGLNSGETPDLIQWDFDANGTFDATRVGSVGAPLPFTYTASGVFDAKVTVTTSSDRTVSATRRIVVTTP